MEPKKIPQQHLKVIIDVLKNFPEIEKATIIGFRPPTNKKLLSDIDIAVSGDKVTHTTVNRLRPLLNDGSIPYFVTILNDCTIRNVEFRKYIQEEGHIIYQRTSRQ